MKAKNKLGDEMRPEYDFDYSKGVRGKYYKQLVKEGAKFIVLEPDVAKAFPNSDAVNEALRSLLEISKTAQRATARATPRTKKRRTAGQ